MELLRDDLEAALALNAKIRSEKEDLRSQYEALRETTLAVQQVF
jgi:hypothetical protein